MVNTWKIIMLFCLFLSVFENYHKGKIFKNKKDTASSFPRSAAHKDMPATFPLPCETEKSGQEPLTFAHYLQSTSHTL